MANLSSKSNLAAPTPPPKARLRGVVFDMDGTLTVPAIDFPAMYRAVLGDDEYLRIKAESPSGIDILHQIENWSPDKQRKAYETIADFERQGLDRLQIMPGSRIESVFSFFWLLFGCRESVPETVHFLFLVLRFRDKIMTDFVVLVSVCLLRKCLDENVKPTFFVFIIL